MDTVFFIASKLIWAVISPDSLIVILGVSAWLCLLFGWQKISRRLLSICAFLLIIIGFLPVGEWLISPLENRFTSNTALPQDVDGIIVLGGAISPYHSYAWNQVELGPGADRLTNFAYLGNLYPNAQLIFTGGTGSVTEQEYKAAEYAQYLFDQLGFSDRAIIYESESRNTYENAIYSKELISPNPGEQWILITSAFHMPRSVGIFCQLDWPVIPYPVDHYSKKGDLLRVEFSFGGNLGTLGTAIREWVGLVAYRVTGRTSQFLPGQDYNCSVAPEPENNEESA
ncbi:MAG: YdcF family protein [Pseudomonadales bacterium]|nr:YdcF family protein [Pseudomonadales bacterium]